MSGTNASSANYGIPLIGGNSAPGNYLFEQNNTGTASPPSTTIGGIVIGCQKGDIQPTVITNGQSQYLQKYGQPNPNWSLASYNALAFCQSNNVIVRRAINTDCVAAASYLFLTSGCAVEAQVGLYLDYVPFQDLLYSAAVPSFSVITNLPNFSSLASSTPVSVTYQLNGGSAMTVNTTLGSNLSQLTANINAALLSIEASVLLGTTGGVPALFFAGPPNATFVIVSMAYSTTTAVPLTTTYINDVLAIIAQNPGAWANLNYGWNITNVNMGTPQQVTISFSRQLVSGDVLNFEGNVYTTGVTVNTNTFNYIASATYATSNDATLTALATALTQSALGVTASAVLPDNTGNNGREIILTFQTANLNGNYYATPSTYTNAINNGPLDYTTAVVNTTVNGGGALSAVIAQSVVGVPSNGQFNLNIWSSSNPNTPAEVWTGSLQSSLNFQTGQTNNIESLVNNDASGSAVVRLVSTLPSNVIVFPNLYDNINKITWLNGGADGSLPTNAQIAAAWGDFSSPENIDVDMLMNGGYTSPIVQQAMDAVCQTRADMCFAYLDIPSASQATAAAAISYRQNQLNINSNRSAIFTPDIYTSDPYTGANIYIPQSGLAATLQAAADNAVGPNQVGAGPIFGVLNGLLGLRTLYSKGDRGLLNSAGINAAKKLRGGGYAIYGAVTLATVQSLLTYIPVRRIFSYVEELILDLLEGVDFQNITPTLELNVQQNVLKQLGLLIANEAIQNGTCITDSTVNTQVYADNGQFNCRVIIYPFSPAQFCVLDAVLTNSSAVFSESVVNA